MRPYNFGAGPAMLPESILCEAQAELLDWQGLGRSVLEISHRSEPFMQLMSDAETELRELLSIPDDYAVLFLPFPARTQFAMVPLNLLSNANSQAAYILSGTWSTMAYQEALSLKRAYTVEPSVMQEPTLRPDTAYVYFTPNETIQGVLTPTPSKTLTQGVPLVADMTSCLLSEPLPINDYGIIFAGAQKNIAPAGLSITLIRKALLLSERPYGLPTMLDYTTHATAQSLYATPAMFQCYLALKMFRWVKQQGGVSAMARINQEKAAKLYAFIDQSSLYQSRVDKTLRSTMNVCFFMQNSALEEQFLQQANARGLYGLKGHKLVGGLRASLYNAMPLSGVDALLEFMQEFEKSTLGKIDG